MSCDCAGVTQRAISTTIRPGPSAAQLRGKIAEVMDAFDDLTRRDEVRADAAAGTCFLVALRRWEPTAFQAFRHSNLADAG